MKLRSIFTAMLVLALVGTMLAACSGSSGGNKDNNAARSGNTTDANTGTVNQSESGSGEAANKEAGGKSAGEPKEFRFTISSEPPSLDPAIFTDSQSFLVAVGLFEGLYRLTPEGFSEPALAESYEVSSDNKTYVFKLRKDAKWSNGDPVTAHDFEYAWKRALAPETASEYAYMLYYLENGQSYNAGEASADDVGVKALDDYTLEVSLQNPTPYFLDVISHHAYWPVNPKAVDGRPDWATEIDTLVTNGPFRMTEWQHGGKIVLTKNPDYYDAGKIHFDKVTITMVEEASTILNLFRTDQIDWIGAQAGTIPTDEVQQLIQSGEAVVQPVASVYYYLFNTTKKPFNNVKVRKALSMSIDRQAIIDNVTKANQKPAYGLVPPGIKGADGKMFRDMYPDDYFRENIEEAKKLLAEGLQEEGLSQFPETTLIYNTSEGHKAIAEAIVDQWRKALGIEVKVANMEWGTFLETRSAQQFDIARAGWGADFNHAINFTYDLIHSTSGNNDGRYNNPEVDRHLDQALATNNDQEAVNHIAQAEKIAIADDMAVLPIYYYTTVTMVKPGFVDVVSDFSGNLYWIFGDKQ